MRLFIITAFTMMIFPLLAHAGLLDCCIDATYQPALILAGLGLLVAEFFLPTKGFLGFLGVIAFVLGTSSLADHPQTALRLSWPAIIGLNVLVLGSVGAIGYWTIRSYQRKNLDATDPLIGQMGTVIAWTDDDKRITVAGGIWNATSTDSTAAFHAGQRVMVTGQHNLTLFITPVSNHD